MNTRPRGVADAALIERAREGDTAAFGELWKRHHKAGLNAARSIAPHLDADDLVSDAFAKILVRLDQGDGPTSGFRPYLYQVIRNSAADVFRKADREILEADFEEFAETTVESEDTARVFNLAATGRAFNSLPERHREVLWYTEVEGLPPRKAAPILGISASAVAALSMRARNGLRAAWLLEHVRDPELRQACRDAIENLAKYHRRQLSAAEREAVDVHVTACPNCSDLMDEAERVYLRPGGIIAASVLGIGTAGALNYTIGTAGPVAAATLLGGLGVKVGVGAAAAIAVVIAVGGLIATSNDDAESTVTHTMDADRSGEDSDEGRAPADSDETSTGRTDAGQGDAARDEGDAESPPLDGSGPDEMEAPADAGASSEQGGANGRGGGAVSPDPEQPSTPARPAEPQGPTLPNIPDSLPQTLPRLVVSERVSANWRLMLRGTTAEPGAVVRLRVTSQPVAGGPVYGVLLQTRAWSTGYWAFANVGGLAPLNVTVEAQQLTDTAASPWVTVVEGASYGVALASTTPRDFNGVTGWYAYGWPESYWALREVGAAWPRASGQFSSGAGAVIPVPGDVPAGESREYEIGYWVKGRFEPSGERLTVRN